MLRPEIVYAPSENKTFEKCPSLPHVTGLKGLCSKGMRRVREKRFRVTSP